MKNIKKTENKEITRAHTSWNDPAGKTNVKFENREISDSLEFRLATGQPVTYSEVSPLLAKIKNESQNNIATSLSPEEQKEQERREASLFNICTLDLETFGEKLDTLFEEVIKKEIKAVDNAILEKMENLAQIPVEYAESREFSEQGIIRSLRYRARLEYDGPRNVDVFKNFLAGELERMDFDMEGLEDYLGEFSGYDQRVDEERYLSEMSDTYDYYQDVYRRVEKFGFNAFFRANPENGHTEFDGYFRDVLESFFWATLL